MVGAYAQAIGAGGCDSSIQMGANAVPIRRMTAQDAEGIAHLYTQLGYPSSVSQICARFAAIDGSDDHALFVAQAPDGRVVGTVHVHVPRLLENDPLAEVWGLVVDAAARGQGIGRELMAEAEAWATARSLRELRLRSNVVRTEAHRFYERLGYTNTKTQFTFTKTIGA